MTLYLLCLTTLGLSNSMTIPPWLHSVQVKSTLTAQETQDQASKVRLHEQNILGHQYGCFLEHMCLKDQVMLVQL